MLRRVLSEPGPVLLALAAGLAVGVLAGVIVQSTQGENGPGPARTDLRPTTAATRPAATTVVTTVAPATTTTTTDAGPDASGPQEFERALERGVARASRLGRVGAAVWVDGWSDPVVVGDLQEPVRMWSMSKPITAIAALELAAREGGASDELDRAIEDALAASSNCAQRRVVLGLQQLARDIEPARRAFSSVLERAAVHDAAVARERQVAIEICRSYLERNRGNLQGDLMARPALLFGTSEWKVEEAAAFAYALGRGTFGDVGDAVLERMRMRKRRSPEVLRAEEYTAALDWGAGRTLAAWRPAYKGGWGGAPRSFVAGQLVVIQHRGDTIALVAYARPHDQPPDDDPGKTTAPEAIETIFREIASVLEQREQVR